VPSPEALAKIPVSRAPLSILRGFGPKTRPETAVRDQTGALLFEVEETGLIQIEPGAESGAAPLDAAGPAIYRGCQIVEGEPRPLPIGSTLDPSTGRFSWHPGPGFLGDFRFVVIKERGGAAEAISFSIRIRPKH
jgi:hypothetical protein